MTSLKTAAKETNTRISPAPSESFWSRQAKLLPKRGGALRDETKTAARETTLALASGGVKSR